MKARFEILGLLIYFIMTVLVIIFNEQNVLTNMWIPIYYMIGILLYFIGKYNGECTKI